MAENLKAGDIVELKSGSPKMTISHLDQYKAYCIWWNETKGTFSSDEFQLNTLQLSPPVITGMAVK